MILDRFRSFTFNRCNLHKDILSHSTTSRAYCHESSLSLKAIQYPFPSTKYIFPNNQMIYIPILFRVESTRLSYCGSGFGHHGMSIHCKFREVILPKVHHGELLIEWAHQFLKCGVFIVIHIHLHCFNVLKDHQQCPVVTITTIGISLIEISLILLECNTNDSRNHFTHSVNLLPKGINVLLFISLKGEHGNMLKNSHFLEQRWK